MILMQERSVLFDIRLSYQNDLYSHKICEWLFFVSFVFSVKIEHARIEMRYLRLHGLALERIVAEFAAGIRAFHDTALFAQHVIAVGGE